MYELSPEGPRGFGKGRTGAVFQVARTYSSHGHISAWESSVAAPWEGGLGSGLQGPLQPWLTA